MKWRVVWAIGTTIAANFVLQQLAGWLIPPPEPMADPTEYIRLQTMPVLRSSSLRITDCP